MNCCKCNREIEEGESYLCLIRNIEKTNFDPSKKMEMVTIYQSDEFLLLCADCGERFDLEKLMDVIDEMPLAYEPLIKIGSPDAEGQEEIWANHSNEISHNIEFSPN